MRFSGISKKLVSALVLCLLVLVLYSWIFMFAPFEKPWNEIWLSVIEILASIATACMATLLFRHYEPGDLPRDVWLNFAIGFWIWVAAEIFYAADELFGFRFINNFSEARVLWMTAFVFFSIALCNQYRIISSPTLKGRIVLVSLWLGSIALTFFLLYLTGVAFTLDNFSQYFNAIGNMVVGIVAVRLALMFRGGLLARAWWGFIAFSISDTLYYVLSIAPGAGQSSLVLLATVLVYPAAYLTLAFGLLSQYLLLKPDLQVFKSR